MKNLSPNAQEFIPIFNNTNNNSVISNNENNLPQNILIPSQQLQQQNQNIDDNGPYHQVLHNYVQPQPQPQQYQFFQRQDQILSPTNSTTTLSNPGSNTQLNNMFSYTVGPPPPPSIQMNMPNAKREEAYLPQYNQFFYENQNILPNNLKYQNGFNKNHFQDRQNQHSGDFNKTKKQKSGDFNKNNQYNQIMLRPNKPVKISNLNQEHFMKTSKSLLNFDSKIQSDKEWPSLDENTHSDRDIDKKKKELVNNVKQRWVEKPVDRAVEVESYKVDQGTLKKLTQNINFIKKTVEQHYLNENNQKLKNFSLKEAVLSKPVVRDTFTSYVNEGENVVEGKNEQIPADTEDKITKSKRKRKKNKKILLENEKMVSENILGGDSDKKEIDFSLKNEDFPGLGLGTDIGADIRMIKKRNSQSDAYLSDNTSLSQVLTKKTPENIKNKTDQSNSKKKSITPLSGKKQNKPILVDFANIVSALEKGQKKDENLKKSKSEKVPLTKNLKSNITSNQLDSCPTKLRGKEREKPKNKKHSTLKKIILKEREEKRLLKRQIITENSEISEYNKDNKKSINEQLKELNIENKDIKIDITRGEKETLSQNSETDEDIYENEDSENDSEGSNNSDESEITDKIYNEGEVEDEEVENSSGSDGEAPSETDTYFEENLNNEDISLKKESAPEPTDTQNLSKTTPQVIYLHEENIKNTSMQTLQSNQMSPISQGSPISIGDPNTPSTSTIRTLNQLAKNRELISLEKLEEQVKLKIHNRKFREYCNQIINPEIDKVCFHLLHEMVRFQDRMYHKNPVKAKTKRRYVMGIREVTKHLKLRKLKCVILAPNCEKIQSKGGLDEAINTIIETAMIENVPFLFALGRKALGKAVNKIVPISVVGIFDYAGAEEYFRRLVELANNAKLAYQEIIEEYENEECESLITQTNPVTNALKPHNNQNIQSSSSNTIILLPSHSGHSRNSSNGSSISVTNNFHHHPTHSHPTHSRSQSGNFNFGQNGQNINHGGGGGHSRSASSGGGAGGTFNSMDLGIGLGQGIHTKHWTHSRTPSNCSNISFISRLSEPISEFGSNSTVYIPQPPNLIPQNVNSSSQYNLPYIVSPNIPVISVPQNNLSGQNYGQGYQNTNSYGQNVGLNNACQYYSEQVRQEMRENNSPLERNTDYTDINSNDIMPTYINKPTSLAIPTSPEAANSQIVTSPNSINLHLGCINEIDQGNEADNESESLQINNHNTDTVVKTITKNSEINNEFNT